MAADNELYDRIKNSLDIADIIGERVKLRRTGRGYMGLCPFHSEKTPSFHVYTDTQSYYCFGCHEGGNIFTYIMKTEGLNFREALIKLAGMAGIDISPSSSSKRSSSSRSIYEVLNMAAKFFSDNLTNSGGTAARAYISRRKLDSSDISRFTLGYSPNSWDSLTNYLRRSGVPDRQILASGLALQNSGGLYDRFRGRLIFPIRDITGRVIAFGGRLIDGEGVKYINSPENETYSKRKNLYLLDVARRSMREKKRSILVEGYMDAVRLHKCGFTEAAASLGTSLTPEQAELLSRFADRCYICYDGDEAGKTAALRGMYILQEHGLDVQVITLPEGKDPDDFLSTNPPEAFELAIKEAYPLVVHHIAMLRPMLENSQTRKSALRELFDGLSRLSPDDVLEYRAQLSDATHLRTSELDELVMNLKRKDTHPVKIPEPQTEAAPSPKAQDNPLEPAMCAMLYHSQELRLAITPEEIMTLLCDSTAQETAISILNENVDELESLWLSAGDTGRLGLIARGDELCAQMQGMNDLEKFTRIFNGLKRGEIERRINEINTLPADKRDMNELAELYRQRGLYNK